MQRLEMKLLSRIMIDGDEVRRLRGFSDLKLAASSHKTPAIYAIAARSPRSI
ncbi:hypothetical protein P3T33_004605 [Rhizobium sp. AN67]|nr:hypothetical protein [Rhizobium sp. AN67]SOD50314.1 hypothetical protein SAMN05216595_0098 [Rhizobium sp. AN6A]